MAGQLLSDSSGYASTEFDTKIPSLNDQANIVEAFKLYHYGIDNYAGAESPAADSMHSHLKDINDRLTSVETIPSVTLTGTANEVNVSASVGNIIVGLPDDVTIANDLTVSHNMTVGGNLTVSGSTTFVNTQSVSVTDPMILLSTNSTSDTLDIGMTGRYSASAYWTGLVRDESDKVWKLFSGVSASPTTQLDFTSATYDNLKIGSLEAIGNISAVNLTATGVSDIRIPANNQTDSYTLVLSDVGKIVEMNVASGNTLTVPPNSSVTFPIGSTITILQTNSGQTTLTPGAGVTINGTPGLKLRAQWSSATLIKRSTDTWVAVGDLAV